MLKERSGPPLHLVESAATEPDVNWTRCMRGVLPDRLGDWRIEAVTETVGDNRTPDGQAIAPGTPLQKISVVADAVQGRLVFPTPSPPALAMSAAIARAAVARRLRGRLRFDEAQKPDGWAINNADVGLLFEFFEETMEAVILSFTALEMFANRVIDVLTPNTLTLPRSRNGKQRSQEMSKEQMERSLTTEEKYTALAQRVLGHSIAEDPKAVEAFRALKAIRDDIVHHKLAGHYVRGGIDKQTIYYRFLNVPPLQHPRQALLCIETISGARRDRWMHAARDALRAAESAS